MRFSHFFIQRPIFAGVLSLIIFIVGAISLFQLPISEYPEVVPPTVVVRAVYPGANPKTIAETVASPLEQAINGIEHSLYMFSQSTPDGVMTLTITFELGTDVDNAQVQVQNRVDQALPKLPEEVRRLGVTTLKASPDLTLMAATMIFTCATTLCCRSRTSWHAFKASARSRYLARGITQCASGSIQTRSPRAT
jgi:multidrug efflux pump